MLQLHYLNKKNLKKIILELLLLILVKTQVFAAAYQIFPTLTYENAATLNLVNHYTVILGGTDLRVNMQYSGFIQDTYGRATSNTNAILPYMRLAYRAHPNWVMSLDVSHPIFANIRYPDTSIVSALSVDTLIRDTNYSPKLSYQLTDFLALGVGFDANNVSNAQVNFGVNPYGVMYNVSSGWGYGWDAGFALTLNKKNFLNLSYYAAIPFNNLSGYSQLGDIYNPNFSDNLVMPATWTLNLIHNLTDQWRLFETFRYIQWAAERNLTLRNDALGNAFFLLNYNNSWVAQIATHYQMMEKSGVGLALEYNSSPQATQYRPIGLPTTAATLVGISLDYKLRTDYTIKAQYAHIFANAPIDQNSRIRALGHVLINVDIVDVGITWSI